MPDFRKQLGLDYLQGTTRAVTDKNVEGSARGYLDDAVIAYGRPILEQLNKSSGGTAKLYSIIDALNIPIETALKVTEELDLRGHLNIVRKDLKGDHELQITNAGRRLVN